MKNEWKWWAGFGLFSVLIVGAGFKFETLDIQLHDTYFVISPGMAIVSLTVILVTTRNLYLLINLLTGRYKIMALLISIINPLAGLFIVILIYYNIQGILTFQELYPEASISGQLVVTLTLIGILGFLSVIEFIALKKVSELLQ